MINIRAINLNVRLLFACYCLVLSAQTMSATGFKIITLQQRFVEDILPIVRPLAGYEGAVTGMQNQLMIRTSTEKNGGN